MMPLSGTFSKAELKSSGRGKEAEGQGGRGQGSRGKTSQNAGRVAFVVKFSVLSMDLPAKLASKNLKFSSAFLRTFKLVGV